MSRFSNSTGQIIPSDESKTPIEYNYKDKATLMREGLEYVATNGADGQGVSVFVQDGGKVLHTYSAYSVLMSC